MIASADRGNHMAQLTTAGRLLHDIEYEDAALRDRVVQAAGIQMEKANAAMLEGARLTLAEQLRLSEAVALLAPKHARTAVRLRAQALAARSFERGDLVDRHHDAPVQNWERSAAMRR
jgi:hypothetical protein